MKIDDTPVALERGLLFQTCCALSSFFLSERENERCLPSSAVIQHVASSLERSENVASRYFHQNPPFSLSSLSLQTNGSLLRGFAVASIKRCFPGLSSSRKCVWTVGLWLGFCLPLRRSAGWFCTVDFNVYGYIWRTAMAQRFGIATMKFKFAVQDAIKPPKLKPHRLETLSR